MANKELLCTDNYTLPKGDRGPRGLIGPTGQQGLAGPGLQGPTGPIGANKIDINLQSSFAPYVEISNTNPVDIAYFIFPGTLVFTPTTWRIGYSILSKNQANTLGIELGYIKKNGTKEIVASVVETQQTATAIYTVKEISSFSNLPADPQIFYISAYTTFTPSAGAITRAYATELRA